MKFTMLADLVLVEFAIRRINCGLIRRGTDKSTFQVHWM